MALPYNMDNVTNATNVLDAMIALDSAALADGWVGRLFLLGLFILIVASISAKNSGILRAVVSASFVCTIVSILLGAIGLVGMTEVMICVFGLIGSGVIALWSGGAGASS